MTTIIFCADPLGPGHPDAAFAAEAAAAEQAGFTVALLSYERLVHEHNPAGAVRRLARQDRSTTCLYRGWMLSVAHYTQLYATLVERDYRPLHTPEVYRSCHELPASYPFIAGHTPYTIWLPQEKGLGLDRIMAALEPFGDQPVIVKDYVKSRKHEWREACFIPSAADRDGVARVTGRFLALQGDDLQGGLVFRAYVPFRTTGSHPQSGMPLAVEHRALIFDGQPLLTRPYWEGVYLPDEPPLDLFAPAIAAIPSRFFTLDLAQREDGIWMIVELGDAQVAGLPPGTDVDGLYTTLAARLLG